MANVYLPAVLATTLMSDCRFSQEQESEQKPEQQPPKSYKKSAN